MAKNKIVLEEWNYRCGDRCCDDWGTKLTINGHEIDSYFSHNIDLLEDILKALGITDYEIEQIDSTTPYELRDWDRSIDEEEDDDVE